MGVLSTRIGRAFKERPHRIVRVPEWDLEIYVYPLTLGQLSRINAETDMMKRLIETLLIRARDKDGELLFDREDADALFSQGVGPYGPDVLIRVVSELGDVAFADEAQVEKN